MNPDEVQELNIILENGEWVNYRNGVRTVFRIVSRTDIKTGAPKSFNIFDEGRMEGSWDDDVPGR